LFQGPWPSPEETNKINVDERDKAEFWNHVDQHMAAHPAVEEHHQNPTARWHQPVGVFGDDARYTLAGRKIVILLLNSVLQQIKRN